MPLRIKVLGALAVIAAAVVAAPQMAPGAKTSAAEKHQYREKVRQAPVWESSDYPAIGSKALAAGVVTATPGGRGAKRLFVTITRISSEGFDFRGTVTNFFANGSIKMKFSGTAVVHPDGSETVTGRGTVTGGTGRFEGARGHITAEGTAPKVGGVITGTGKGTVVY